MGFVGSGVLRSILMKDGDEYTSDFFFPGTFVCIYQFPFSNSGNGIDPGHQPGTIYYLTYRQFNEMLATSSEWYKLGKYNASIAGHGVFRDFTGARYFWLFTGIMVGLRSFLP